MDTNYVTRDNFGMYANSASGPGPALMGANTLLGNDVYNKDGEDLGDIKEFITRRNSTFRLARPSISCTNPFIAPPRLTGATARSACGSTAPGLAPG